MNAAAMIKEAVAAEQAKEIEYAKKQLASWEWNLKNTNLPEAAIRVEYWKDQIEVVLPEIHAMQA